MRRMGFLRDNWFRLGVFAFACMAFWALFLGDGMDMTRRLLLASLMALPMHQFEEYQMPGGGPVVINRYFYGEKELFRHYPGNWGSIMVVNLSAYVFYALALAFPRLVWLGLATMLFNLYQVLGHCVQMNVKMRTWYNPGMATALLLFLPISCAYIARVVGVGMVGASDWVLAVIVFVMIAALTVVLPVQGLKRRDSPLDIPQWQVDRLERVRALASVGRGKGGHR
jgi:hypothetical protein